MKSWCLSIILIIVLTITAVCLESDELCNAVKNSKESNEISFSDESNSYSSSSDYNKRSFEPIDVEAHIAEDPNLCLENETVLCDPASSYRTINGTCNNLYHPSWGVSNQSFLRFQPAFYEGFGSFRVSIEGDNLPEPRLLTLNIFKHKNRPTKKVSFMFPIFGQTVGHDVSLSLQGLFNHGPCCEPENKDAPNCRPIRVSSHDPFYSKFNVTCLEFNRTVACTTCKNAKRQQLNINTAALDASIVYGSDDEKAYQVRANDGTGKLKSYNSTKGELMPLGNDPLDIFCKRNMMPECFLAGDVRVNQHTPLSIMHTLYLREHNRLAIELKKLNPHWGEERLYQEARRINIAELQCMAYKEFLPHLLGPSLVKQFDLSLKSGSRGSKYNSKVRLGVWSEFSAAAFRLHSMIASDVGALHLKFKNLYSNPDLIHKGHMDQILQGVCKVPSEKHDHWYVNDTTDFLYKQSDMPYGNDLTATDIKRGRDHGLAPYVHLVRFCFGNNTNISSFEDLAPGLMSRSNANLLKRNYKSVEDVDLYAGIHMEHHLPGSEVGPTAACIIAKQMYATKFGDRFYIEHEGEVPSFIPDQRASLKQCSLSRMICDNTRIKEIQKNPMLLPSTENPKVSCDEIPRIDLTLWKESSST